MVYLGYIRRGLHTGGEGGECVVSALSLLEVQSSPCDEEVVTIEEMEVESGAVEVLLNNYIRWLLCCFQDAVPEYTGTLTLKNYKVKMLGF